MRKIFFVIDSLLNGGAERTVCNLANGFSTKGTNVSIVVFSGISGSFYELNEEIDIIILKRKKWNKIQRILMLRRLMKYHCDDVFISFLPQICIYTYFASLFLKTPFILSERSDPYKYSFTYKFLLKRAFNKANGCVFQSEQSLKFYFDDYKKSIIILNPVSIKKLPIRPIKRKKIIFSVGRLMEEKNFPLLFEAFQIFGKDHNDYILNIIGNGPLNNKLECLIAKMNLSGKIILKGSSKNWHNVCLDYACYVCSSDFEGMSNSLEEAACLGIPCISTNCPIGGNAKILNNGEFGLLVPTKDSRALAEAMKTIIEKQLFFDNQKLYDFCKISKIVEEWEDFIDKVCK